MSHNLNYNALLGQYSYAGIKPAWHQLGQIVENAMTSEEALKEANLDYQVDICPLFRNVKTFAFSEEQFNDWENYQEVDNVFCTVRRDTNELLGVVKGRYTVLQNRDAFTFFDSIVGEGKAIFESVGALGKGEVVFITAKLPQRYHIPGDESTIENYLVLTNGHDGNHMLSVYFTPISVVCQNTLNASLKNNSHKITIKHTSSVKERLQLAPRIMGIQDTIIGKDQELLQFLATQQLSYIERDSILNTILDIKDRKDISTRMANILDSFYMYSDQPVADTYRSLRGTKYAFYQDLTGWMQHVVNKGIAEKNMDIIMQDGISFQKINAGLNLLVA